MASEIPDFSMLGSSTKPSIEVNRPESPSGLWRCGNVLIAKKHIAKFPDRCVESNEQAVGTTTIWAGSKGITPSSPLKWLLYDKFGILLGDEMFHDMRRKFIELKLGVGRKFVARKKRKKLLALLVLLLILPAVGCSIWLFKITENVRGNAEFLYMILAFFIPFIPLALGLWLLVDKQPVKAEKLDEQYAIILGVHRDYLAEFPEWDIPLPPKINRF